MRLGRIVHDDKRTGTIFGGHHSVPSGGELRIGPAEERFGVQWGEVHAAVAL
jgi:hypothetical protein